LLTVKKGGLAVTLSFGEGRVRMYLAVKVPLGDIGAVCFGHHKKEEPLSSKASFISLCI